MIGFLIWYGVGLISTSLLVFVTNRSFSKNMTYGDLAFIVFLSFGGFFLPPALVLIAFGVGLIKIFDLKIWSKTIGNKPTWRD